MGKLTGYIIMAVGLAIVASPMLLKNFLPAAIKSYYVMIIGLAVMALGFIFLDRKGSSKIKHAEEEVPIYEGTGKHRKIVGYHRSKE